MWPASSVMTLSSWVNGSIWGGDPLLLIPTPERVDRASAAFDRAYREAQTNQHTVIFLVTEIGTGDCM